MRHGTQTFLGNEFTRDAAYAVCFVFDAQQSGLKMLYEVHLPVGKACGILFAESAGALFKRFECGRGIGSVVCAGTCDVGAEKLVVATGFLKLGEDELLEFLKFFVAVACFFHDKLKLAGKVN